MKGNINRSAGANLTMPRRTLDQYPARLQGQIVAALHPKMPPQASASPAPRPAKPLAGMVTPTKQTSGKCGAYGYPFTIYLSYRVPSLNRVSGRWGKVEANRVAAKALAAVLPILGKYPRQGATRLHLLYTSYVCQLRDVDNPTTKFLNDAFRAAGLLRNDDPACMTLTYNPEVRVNKRALEGTKVTFVEDPL